MGFKIKKRCLRLLRFLRRRFSSLSASFLQPYFGYIGDAVAQMVIEKKEKYDFVRGTRLAGFTFLIWAPLANRW